MPLKLLYDVSVLATGWARPAVGRTGVHRVVDHLFGELVHHPDVRLELCSRSRTPDALEWARQDDRARYLPFHANPIQRIASRQPRLRRFAAFERALRPDVRVKDAQALLVPHFHHLPNNGRSFSRRALLVHDAFPLTHPEWFCGEETAVFERAKRIIHRDAWSMVYTARETRRWSSAALGLPDEGCVAHLGIDHDLFRIPVDSGDDLARRLDLNGPWFCTVGTHEPRKNLATVVRAFDLLLKRLGDSDLLLVLAGVRGWKNDEFDALLQGCAPSTRGRIRTPGFLDDSDLPILYARSCGFLFPSLEEGFGLPPLEAMACGAPVIASSSSCMPEILGEAALLVPSCSVESWCEAMATLVTPDGPAARLREAGPRHAAGFTWRMMADRLVESLIRTPD